MRRFPLPQTPMNQASTRSHCIFTVHVCRREPGSATVRRSKLHLVDLAGSDRVSKTGLNGQLLTEAKFINRSLHYLEQVMRTLTATVHSAFVPRAAPLCCLQFFSHFLTLSSSLTPHHSSCLYLLMDGGQLTDDNALPPTGDPGTVGEEPLPHPLQELHADISAQGQSRGKLLHHHDRHNGGGQEECGCEHNQHALICWITDWHGGCQ